MINDRLSFFQIAVLTAYSIGMSAGQILFKMAANRSNTDKQLTERLLDLLLNGYFVAAMLLYAGFAVLWVWILTVTPLSRAYPFVAFAFVLTPLLGGLLFNETVSIKLLAGTGFILCGLFLVSS
jgi:drug/metabolite transporter (DMT)-like permease